MPFPGHATDICENRSSFTTTSSTGIDMLPTILLLLSLPLHDESVLEFAEKAKTALKNRQQVYNSIACKYTVEMVYKPAYFMDLYNRKVQGEAKEVIDVEYAAKNGKIMYRYDAKELSSDGEFIDKKGKVTSLWNGAGLLMDLHHSSTTGRPRYAVSKRLTEMQRPNTPWSNAGEETLAKILDLVLSKDPTINKTTLIRNNKNQYELHLEIKNGWKDIVVLDHLFRPVLIQIITEKGTVNEQYDNIIYTSIDGIEYPSDSRQRMLNNIVTNTIHVKSPLKNGCFTQHDISYLGMS